MKLPRVCVILTGAIGSGKTSAMRAIFEALAADGRRASAVIQEAKGRRPDGAALGFEMEYLKASGGRIEAERVDLARELKEGELPIPGCLALGRFVFERGAFAGAERFVRSALEGKGKAEALGLDEIGRLEMLRGEGLMDCLELALAALAGAAGPRVLVCSAREDSVVELLRMAQEAGLRTETFDAARSGEALAAARRALLA
jgi:nucleoside-triphosphatase THEP1